MNPKGSALVFSLIVLSFLLISALSIAAVSVTERRSSLASKNSNISYQAAESASEKILQAIYQVNDKGTTLNKLDDLALNIGATCSQRTINGSIGAGTYVATFWKINDPAIPTYTAIDCGGAWRDAVVKITFQGVYQGTTRIISVGVKPMGLGPTDYVAYWKLDDGIGIAATDSNGNINPGTLHPNDMLWVLGKVGPYALNFNGSNSYVSVPDSSLLRIAAGSPVTLVAWIKPASLPFAVPGEIVGKGVRGVNGYGININGSSVNIGSHGGSNFNSTATLTAGNWYHIVGIINGANTKIYINGVADASTGTVNTPANTIDTVNIGAVLTTSPNTYGNYFNGTIDDVRIYARALTASEIMTLYAGS